MTTIITPAEIKANHPDQVLSKFRDRDTNELVRFKGKGGKRYAVFYLASDGQTFCFHCANQEDAEPPIVAGQLNGNGEHDEMRQCDGCGASIWPLELVVNKNTVFITLMKDGKPVTSHCVSYETPVATYDFRNDRLEETDINWSSSTGKHVREFGWYIRGILAERLGVERTAIPYQRPAQIKQEFLDEQLKVLIGSIRLPSKRDPRDYIHQERMDTVVDYDVIPADLRATKTDRMVIKPNRQARRFRQYH